MRTKNHLQYFLLLILISFIIFLIFNGILINQLRRNSEKGKGIQVKDQKKAKKLFSIHQFNVVASDLLPLNRSLPDYRNRKCTEIDAGSLGNVSVIIIFHNEAWSTLVRTILSVLSNTPHHLIHQIILVDDFSSMEHLGTKLNTYIKSLPVSMLLVRMRKRSGIVGSRLAGARRATARTLVFLDSHCECTPGWLPPLLTQITLNKKRIASPQIDVIKMDTFEYKPSLSPKWGAFDWKLNFKWYPLSREEKLRRKGDVNEAIRTPAIAGGLMVVDKKFFFINGGYDEQLFIWGAENIELSLRTWMCGGELVIVPCSRVGHVFRTVSPYTFPGGANKVLRENNMRVAKAWMDEWVYLYSGVMADNFLLHKTNVSARLKLRERLGCVDFKWYLLNIFHHSQFPLNHRFLAHLQNKQTKKCLTITGKQPHLKLVTSECRKYNTNQLFLYNKDFSLQNENHCLDTSSSFTLVARPCSFGIPTPWTYHHKNKSLIHVASSTCLQHPPSNLPPIHPFSYSPTISKGELSLETCRGDDRQSWNVRAFHWQH